MCIRDRTTGGKFQRAKSGDELREIYEAIEALEPIEQDPEIYRPTKALYYWPLSLAIIVSLVYTTAHPALISRTIPHLKHLATRRRDTATGLKR